MKTLVHISDLHFGRVDPAVCRDLVTAVWAAKPDLVAVSGDLTQRARRAQFAEARRFLDALPAPRIVVPGNHDVPLYDLFNRFFRPLARFRRLISDDLAPFHSDGEIAVAGINTARSLTFKDGRINARQLALVTARFARLPAEVTRIIVVHHPFESGDLDGDDDIVGRAGMAMDAFARSRVDLVLAGHMHAAGVVSSARRYRIQGYAALLIQAGTATSRRLRDEPNSFNVIRVQRPRLELDCMTFAPGQGFLRSSTQAFALGEAGWSPLPPDQRQGAA